MRDRTLVPLFGLVGLLVFTLGAVTLGRGAPSLVPPTNATQASLVRDLRFEDTAGGDVLVRDSTTGREIALLPPGSNGFIRATLRGLARERRQGEHGAEAPFRIAAWDDGRVVLTDTATGRAVELLAFGATNADAFAKLLRD
ncbi:MAG: photosynthetic complex assembly protein PuhC [Pseudomonadota bacterium]